MDSTSHQEAETSIESVQRYLREGLTESARLLAKRPVIVAWPVIGPSPDYLAKGLNAIARRASLHGDDGGRSTTAGVPWSLLRAFSSLPGTAPHALGHEPLRLTPIAQRRGVS